MTVSANLPHLVETLAAAHKGFTGLIYPKVGRVVGGKRYGDDLVHALVVTGFKYMRLVTVSKAEAEAMTADDKQAIADRGLMGWERVWKKSAKLAQLQEWCRENGLDDSGKKADLVARLDAEIPGGMRQVPVTREIVDAAVDAVVADLQRTIDGDTKPTTADVFEPLLDKDGNKVRGARVYKGSTDPDAKLAAPVGTVYLQGLLIGQKVLTAAENGPIPRSKSAPLQVAKRVIRAQLKIGRYTSFKLAPADEEGTVNWLLNAGGVAACKAQTDEVEVDEAVLEGLV
jgi:hypothetical protein